MKLLKRLWRCWWLLHDYGDWWIGHYTAPGDISVRSCKRCGHYQQIFHFPGGHGGGSPRERWMRKR